MANIKDLKKKIRSTKSTLKITSAMKLVSAAKLARAQQAIVSARPYATELDETIKTVAALIDKYSHPYLEQPTSGKNILLVISSDRGLCGGYNSQLAREVRSFIRANPGDVELYFIGKKVRELVSKDCAPAGTFTFVKSEPSFQEIKKVAADLASLFIQGKARKVLIAYNEFKSAISFTPNVKQILPMSLDESSKQKIREKVTYDFKYAPGPDKILDTLIPSAFINTINTCLLDAVASEHGSRMTAMDNASKNCKEAIRIKTLKMNKLRQAKITTELIEVVSGAESLNNG